MYKEKPKHILENALDFEHTELEANADGQMSVTQRTRLRQDFGMWLMSNLALIVPLVLLNIRNFQTADSNSTWGTAILVFVFGTGLYLWTLNKLVRVGWDMVAAEVKAVEGYIELDIKGGGKGGPLCLLSVGGIRFNVSKDMFLAFKNNEPYMLYYLPHTKRILSAEWLRPHGKSYEAAYE